MPVDKERLKRSRYVIISDKERLRLKRIKGTEVPSVYPVEFKSSPIFYNGLPVGSVSRANRNVITNIAFALEHLKDIEYYYGS